MIRRATAAWKRRPGTGDKSPLLLGEGGRGVLCLHGFSGTPFEVRPLAEALAGRGFTVSAPLLAGHGTSVSDLGRTHWPDWQASAEDALDRLIGLAAQGPVGVAGFSMGGLLALRLARARPEHVAALVVMSAPLRMRPLQVRAVRLLAKLPGVLRRGPLAVLPKLGGYDVADEAMQVENPGLTALPVAGVASLLDLGQLVRAELPLIKVPALVAHGERDRTVPIRDAHELASGLASDVVERLWLPRSGHLIAIDVERSILADAACRFLSTHVHPTSPPPEARG